MVGKYTRLCFVLMYHMALTHWGWVMHICISKLTNIASDNCLLPGRRQAIIWTNAGILFIGPLETNFSEISIEILTFSFKEMRLKVSSVKQWPFCVSLHVLTHLDLNEHSITNNTFQCIFWKESICISQLSANLFPRIELKISYHWFRQWFVCYVPGYCLN